MLGKLVTGLLRETIGGAAAIVKAPITIADAIAQEADVD